MAQVSLPSPVIRPSLSPSRANDFQQCPLLYRLRVIDRIPEEPSAAASRGTLVHSVLENLFDAPAGNRTLELASAAVPDTWKALVKERPELKSLVPRGEQTQWFATAVKLLETYFSLEDPNRLEPTEREIMFEHQVAGGPLLRGIVDRLDVAPNGAIRVVDYKTGKSPRPAYSQSAAFQMRFYAVMLWRERGVIPASLQLIYLGDGQILRNSPTVDDLLAAEAKIASIWASIQRAGESAQFRPKRSALCPWCAHQSLCPEFGGTPPPIPADGLLRATGIENAKASDS